MKPMQSLTVGGKRLEYAWHGPGPKKAATLVFLHDGLGCAALWRDFPEKLAESTGCGAFAYSRLGHGGSGAAETSRSLRFMHDEARLLTSVLDAAGIQRAILVGQSDGGSITAALREYRHGTLRDRLARYHGANVDSAFGGWAGAWLDAGFGDWNIEPYLPRIRVPVLAIQGDRDDYGTLRQIEAIQAGCGGPVEALVLPGVGHSPHREEAEKTLAAIVAFLQPVLG
jgi:pimeloyl-ACP methyl ester carboxylesterase